MPLTVSDISADLAARIDALAEHLYPHGHRDGLEWRVGSTAGEPGDSLGIHLGDGARKGTWKDFASGEGGDQVDLVRAALSLPTLGDAVRWAKNWLGSPDDGPPGHRRRAAPQRQLDPGQLRKQAHARGLWTSSVPAAGTLVETYLASRGITMPLPATLRFNPSLRHTGAGVYRPGMVAAVTDLDGTILAVHRTYLAGDGLGKAWGKSDGHDSKMCLGPLGHGAIQLAPAGPVLGVAEGIETALSVMQVWTDLPVWCAVSAVRLGTIALPAQVKHIVILADGDEPGQLAAEVAVKALHARRLDVTVVEPPCGRDFNDLLHDGSLEAELVGRPTLAEILA